MRDDDRVAELGDGDLLPDVGLSDTELAFAVADRAGLRYPQDPWSALATSGPYISRGDFRYRLS
ncbi:hypothetical protein C6Y44_20575 [Rhodococcus rhodochrous]|nr:hypothetical protein C6Y44_20575 [Rhodococcus rhodochrous]